MNFFVILCMLLKNIIYGLSVLFTGNLTESLDVLDVLALRFLMSFVVMFLLKVFKIIKIDIGLKDIFRKTERSKFVRPLLLAGLFEPVLYMFFETLGISQTSAVTAGVLLALAPAAACICELIVLKEKCSFLHKLFLAAGIIGVVYIAVNTNTNDGTNTIPGILFIILAMVFGQLYCVFSRKSSSHFAAFDISYIACILGAVIFNAVNIVRHCINGTLIHYFDPYLNTENLIGFAYLSILSTIVATAMQNYALSKAHVSSLSAFGGVSTIVTVAAGVIFENEQLFPYHIAGFLLIAIRMVGVSYIDIKNSKQLANKNTP